MDENAVTAAALSRSVRICGLGQYAGTIIGTTPIGLGVAGGLALTRAPDGR